ncbi:MAG: SDR family oxidoreductase [Bryobacteraceae bacterium]|nr:SDR family oxidoreductase [Bryobacteraceae bacterium]
MGVSVNRNLLRKYGEWAVVTGASSGIGRETAVQLAGMGFKLLLVARRAAELERLRAEVSGSGGIEAAVLPLDLAIPGASAEVFEAAAGFNTGLLVNAAGFGLGGPFLDHELSQESSMIDVNCRALMELTHHFGRRFAAQRRGGIILFSSIVAFQGVPLSANYAATKAYVQSLGEALADELSPLGVDVLVSQPGPTHSGFGDRAGMKMGRAEKAEDVAAATLATLGRKRRVTPGVLSKFLLGSLMTAPRSLRVQIMKAIMRSMT